MIHINKNEKQNLDETQTFIQELWSGVNSWFVVSEEMSFLEVDGQVCDPVPQRGVQSLLQGQSAAVPQWCAVGQIYITFKYIFIYIENIENCL